MPISEQVYALNIHEVSDTSMSAHFVSSVNSSASIAAAFPWTATATVPWIDQDGALMTTGRTLHFKQDREIFSEGHAAETFFQVVQGVVRTCKFLSDGHRQIDGFHVAGDVFGFEAGVKYRLSAEAVTDCKLTAHRRCGLEGLAKTDLALSLQLFAHAVRSMTRAQNHSLLLGRRSAIERVAAFLMEWSKHSDGGETITLAMTRQDIADYLGLTIETVSRTLSQLERDAVIDIPMARQIQIKNLAALRSINF